MITIFHRLDPHAAVLTVYGKPDIQDDMIFSECYATAVLLARSEGNDLRAPGWDGSSALPDRFVSEGYLEVARYAEAADHGVLNSTVDAAAADTPSAIPRKTKTDQDNNIWMESEEEGDDGSPNLIRAQRRALQREIPWRRIDPKDRKAMADATVKGWSEWLKWNSVRQIPYLAARKIPKELILPSRLAYRWKPVHEPPWSKAKARLVCQGFRDPHLHLLARDSPVLSRAGMMCLLQASLSHGFDLWSGDCKSAFLQGQPDGDRPQRIYMSSPRDTIATSAVDEWTEPCVYKLISGVYGQANAPRLWYMEVKRRLFENGWEQHTLDPCLFMRRRRDADTGEVKLVGIVGFHVDDMILGCACDEFGLNVKNELHSLFEWGGEWKHNEFTFCGRLLKHDPGAGTIHLSQAAYISDIDVHSLRNLDPTTKLTPEQLSDFRSGVGSLQWVASMTHPDIAADTSLLQNSPSELTAADLSEVPEGNTFRRHHHEPRPARRPHLGALLRRVVGQRAQSALPGRHARPGRFASLPGGEDRRFRSRVEVLSSPPGLPLYSCR